VTWRGALYGALRNFGAQTELWLAVVAGNDVDQPCLAQGPQRFGQLSVVLEKSHGV
jgi:hypothetical protein